MEGLRSIILLQDNDRKNFLHWATLYGTDDDRVKNIVALLPAIDPLQSVTSELRCQQDIGRNRARDLATDLQRHYLDHAGCSQQSAYHLNKRPKVITFSNGFVNQPAAHHEWQRRTPEMDEEPVGQYFEVEQGFPYEHHRDLTSEESCQKIREAVNDNSSSTVVLFLLLSADTYLQTLIDYIATQQNMAKPMVS